MALGSTGAQRREEWPERRGGGRALGAIGDRSQTGRRHREPPTEASVFLLCLQMKTVSVALVLCLNVGVDPPDVVKTTPCARLECWIGKQGPSLRPVPKAL